MDQLLRDRAEALGKLADLLGRYDGDAVDDITFLSESLSMLRAYLENRDSGIHEQHNQLELAMLAVSSETMQDNDLGRMLQLRRFLRLTSHCDDARFAQLVTDPLENSDSGPAAVAS